MKWRPPAECVQAVSTCCRRHKQLLLPLFAPCAQHGSPTAAAVVAATRCDCWLRLLAAPLHAPSVLCRAPPAAITWYWNLYFCIYIYIYKCILMALPCHTRRVPRSSAVLSCGGCHKWAVVLAVACEAPSSMFSARCWVCEVLHIHIHTHTNAYKQTYVASYVCVHPAGKKCSSKISFQFSVINISPTANQLDGLIDSPNRKVTVNSYDILTASERSTLFGASKLVNYKINCCCSKPTTMDLYFLNYLCIENVLVAGGIGLIFS